MPYEWSHGEYESSISGRDEYRLLQCCGCDRVYLQIISYFSENNPPNRRTIKHWPEPEKRPQPDWVIKLYSDDSTLYSLLAQTYQAYNLELSALAAVGMRAVFDRTAEELAIDPDLSFLDKLGELVRRGKIAEDEKGALDVLIDAGSAAIHRGWRPRSEQLDTMIEILESFVYRHLFIIKAAAKLRPTVPARPIGKRKPNS